MTDYEHLLYSVECYLKDHTVEELYQAVAKAIEDVKKIEAIRQNTKQNTNQISVSISKMRDMIQFTMKGTCI